jgi:starch phosphorylase
MPEPKPRTPGPREGRFQYDPVANDPESLRHSVANRLLYSIGKDPAAARGRDWTSALSLAVRDRLVERWMETARRQRRDDARRVYYLSMEFLPGRALGNALLALGIEAPCREALAGMELDLDEIQRGEPDPALGNGGLGRLAACFLDSMATLGVPAYGYGIRYDYGMFAQRLHDGRQVEAPDHWLLGGNPWEFPRPEVVFPVRFGGRVEHGADGTARWVDTDDVLAMAYDTIVPGFETDHVVTLRLWSARATQDIVLSLFNRGDHDRAVESKYRAENVSRVLYPDDSSARGRELRLRQEYFFASASLQDILRRHSYPRPLGERDNAEPPRDLAGLADKAAIHLNDTHPVIAVPELMRLLVDEYGLAWDKAWETCRRVFSYTNHTLMPEALESWPVDLLGGLLPRHLEIIYEINAAFLDWVRTEHPEDADLPRRVSLIDEEGERSVRMGWLAVLASHRVNGVSALHSALMTRSLFADFARLFPERFINVTNGITPRRWLNQANRPLAALVDEHIGREWRRDLNRLAALRPLAEDAGFRAAFRAAKSCNKRRLAADIRAAVGVEVSPDSLFDVQIKRIHEYKRQLLNVLHVVTRYHRIVADPQADWVPRTVIFAGKAASAYFRAKLIIKLIHDVARVVNADARVGDRLRVVFMPDYSVSVAERIVPAADLSEQISTAGTEASGTGNMKLALNGALTLGTEDGANLEICDQVGRDNVFLFGHNATEIASLRGHGYDPVAIRDGDPELARVLDAIAAGAFSPDDPGRFQPLLDALLREGDPYFVLADYRAYVQAQERVDVLYRDAGDWSRRAILNVAGMGPFSTDRTVGDYARRVWGVLPAGSGGES